MQRAAAPRGLWPWAPRGGVRRHAPRPLILAAAGKGLAGRVPPLPLPLRFFQRGGLTIPGLCAMMSVQGLTGRTSMRSTACGVHGQQRALHLGGWGALFLRPCLPPGIHLESRWIPLRPASYMAFFRHHSGQRQRRAPCAPRLSAQITFPKLSTTIRASCAPRFLRPSLVRDHSIFSIKPGPLARLFPNF